VKKDTKKKKVSIKIKTQVAIICKKDLV